MPAKRIILGWELEALEHALEGARLLCDVTRYDQYGTEHDLWVAPHAAAAVVNLVRERLRLVRQVAQGDVGAEVLVGRQDAPSRGKASW